MNYWLGTIIRDARTSQKRIIIATAVAPVDYGWRPSIGFYLVMNTLRNLGTTTRKKLAERTNRHWKGARKAPNNSKERMRDTFGSPEWVSGSVLGDFGNFSINFSSGGKTNM